MSRQPEEDLLGAVSRAERTGTQAQLANALDHLAVHHHEQGEYEKAASAYGRALGIWRIILGPEHPSVGTLLVNLAAIHQHLGDLVTARPLFRHALAIFENDVELDDPGIIDSLERFVAELAASGWERDAESLEERVRRIKSRVVETVQVRR